MKETLFPLTQAQQRIWLTQNMYPQSSMYTIGGTVAVDGCVDGELLRKAIQTYLNTHDAFSIRIVYEQQTPMQYFSTDDTVVGFLDFSQEDNVKEKYRRWEDQQALTPFDLLNSPLYSLNVIKWADTYYGYFIKLHHIIADGWSMQLLTNGIHENYLALKEGRCVGVQDVCDYRSFISDEQEYLNSCRYEKDKEFWIRQLQGFDAPKINGNRYIDGRRTTYLLSESQSANTRQYCRRYGVSVNSLFTSLYILYAYKILGMEELVIGIPVLGRSGKRQRSTVGMFVSSMPLRFSIGEVQTFSELVKSVDTVLLQGFAHQKYPYNHLIRDVGIQDNALIDICINYYGTSMCSQFDGYPATNTEFYNGQQAYALQIIVREWLDNGRIQLDIDALNSLYSASQISELFSAISGYHDVYLSDPEKSIECWDLVKKIPIADVNIGDNDAPQVINKSQTIVDMFERQADNTPDEIAIECEGACLTYNEVCRKSQMICNLLYRKKAPRNSIIGIMTTLSIDSIPAILGIMTYGCAFLPIDPQTPYKRVKFMLEDSSAVLLLTNVTLAAEWDWEGDVFHLSNMGLETERNTNKGITADMAAYVIYTSGSTGEPKGVVITHGNLVNYLCWAKAKYAPEKETFALYTSLAFDLTITTLFTPLISGGMILVYPGDSGEHALYRILKENRCTVIKLTPSHLLLLSDRRIPQSNIKRLIVGGEELKTSLAQKIKGILGTDVEIINEYGPTEATVGCMIHQFDSSLDTESSVPIGVPSWNNDIYILDEHLLSVPPGTVGDLYISGNSVARGYLNQPELTGRRFIYHAMDGTEKRLYHTGDRAIFTKNGRMIYCGRNDSQAKIRGHRIELSEIEGFLEKHPEVQFACTRLMEDNGGQPHLCAYYSGKKELEETVLREFLIQNLPVYMVPDYFIFLSRLPTTVNGKLDIHRLPPPDWDSIRYSDEDDLHQPLLLKICTKILRVEAVSIKDNFFHIGGDSIKAIQISSKMREAGLILAVKDILGKPDFQEMLQCVKEPAGSAISQELCEGSIDSVPIVTWFFTRGFCKPQAYCQTMRLIFRRPVTAFYLQCVLKEVIRHHDALRINVQTGNRLFYNNHHLEQAIQIDEYRDAKGRHMDAGEMEKQLVSKMDLANGLLFQTGLLHLPDRTVWCLAIHHLLIDGYSWRILIEDIHTSLDQLLRGQRLYFPPKTDSYQKWASAVSEDRTEQKFEPDQKVGIDSDVRAYRLSPDRDLTDRLLGEANKRYSTKPAELLLAGLLNALADIMSGENWLLLLEGHGRDGYDEMDISRTIGWFTRLMSQEVKSFPLALEERIIWCKETLRNAQREGYPLTGTGESETPSKTLRFNYLGDFQTDYPLFEANLVFPEQMEMTETIEFDAVLAKGRLDILLRLHASFNALCAENLFRAFSVSLHTVVDHCRQTEDRRFTPSDFPAVSLSQEQLDSLFV